MLFMVSFHFGPEGGGPLLAARWQHGPTPGVKVVAAWVSAGYSDDGPEPRITYVFFHATTREQVDAFTGYLKPYCARIEIRPVDDYLPFMRAYEAGDPEGYPRYPPDISDEARQRQLQVFRDYMAAPTPGDAVHIWRSIALGRSRKN